VNRLGTVKPLLRCPFIKPSIFRRKISAIIKLTRPWVERYHVGVNGRKRRQPRARKRLAEPGQLGLFKTHGGKRPGAGRPRTGARVGAPHKVRPALAARYPVHVVLRVVAAVGNLRRRSLYRAVREATLTAARLGKIRIVHLSLQRTHVHLLVEANGKGSLARGMQGFQISAAKQINAALSKGRPGPRRRGSVFPDRYHAEIITSPRQARHALSYVINNWRKHGEDRRAKTSDWWIDWFSSAVMFPDWREYGGEVWLWRWPPTYEPLWVYRPGTWLLREGWKRHGTTISCRDVPSRGMARDLVGG